MKKALLSFAALFAAIFASAQVCVPDTSYNTPGIYPLNGTSTGFDVFMPDAQVGVLYNEIIQIKAPSDTIIDTMGFQIPATIDTIQILSFSGMPASISYVCDNANCIWVGGDNGCATFSGTPVASEVGLHEIDIVALGTVNLGFLGTLTDTIEFKMELTVIPFQGIDEYISSASVQFAPNPFTNVATLSFQALAENDFSFKITDVTGRTIRETNGKTDAGFNQILVDRNGLPNGMYFFSLQIAGEALTGRIAITN